MLAKIRKIRKIIVPVLLGLMLGSFLVGSMAFAQLETGLEYGTATGLGTGDLRVTVMNIIRVALGFLGVLALVIIFYGGWVWMTAGGNADRVAQAKKILVNAVIGLVIILSSFMITSFIINQLLDATGAGDGRELCQPGDAPPNSCSSCINGRWTRDLNLPGCRPDDFDQCFVVNITPSGNNKPMNSIARVRFNLPNITNAGNVEVYDITNGPTGVLVPTTQNISGNTIELTPIAACPAPNSGLNCFAANSTFEIRSDDPDITCGGFDLECGGLGGSNCIQTFTTGSALDLAEPTITIINNQVCQDPASRLEAFVNDDYGIAYVDFFQNSTPAGSDGYVTVPPAEIASTPWDTSAYNVGDVITIDATAVDYDSNTTNATPVDIPIRAGHCCNLVQDADETGLNCGGNDCEACTPVIEWVDPLDGAPDNLITIHGRRFESTPGQVIFTGSGAAGVDPSVLNSSCTGYWTDKEVVIAVPGAATDGAIQVIRDDGESDRTDQAPGTLLPNFDVNTTVRPGLCEVVPTAGPVSLPILLDGLNFANPIAVYFGGLLSGGNPNAVSTTLISQARVPLLSDRDVQVRSFDITSSEFSNPVTFSVDSTLSGTTFECSRSVLSCAPGDADDILCNPGFECNTGTCGCEPIEPPCNDPGECEIACDADINTPVCDPDNNICPGGYVCGTSCVCQRDVAAGNSSSYTWFFTTTSLGPRVAETCNRSFGCEVGSISSPTPFNRTGTNVSGAVVGSRPDDGAVPIDAIVGANFTDQMQSGTLNSTTITVSQCGSASAPFNAANCTAITGTINSTAINFEYIPNGALATDSWYRATLNAPQIFGDNGVALSPNDANGNYSWVFRTRTVTTPGEVGCVYVQPANQTSYFVNDLKDWNGQAADRDSACVILNPQVACSVGWGWSTGGSEAVIDSALINNATTRAVAETFPDPGVPVIAECSTQVGSISGTATHNIDFTSPVVTAKFPNCGTACLNSKIGATFNLPMDNVSVVNAISLHICFDDPNCAATLQNQIPFETFTPNDPAEDPNSYTAALAGGDIDGDGQDDYWLLPNNYYRVVIAGTAQSAAEGEPLANLNYDTDGNSTKDAYTWVFRTRPNYGACLPFAINVKPSSALSSVGNSLLYSAVAKTSFEQCFAQSLDPYSFNWAWQSTDTAVANFRLPLRNACGNGVVEQGEDCDDGNLDPGDGCSNVCLLETDSDLGSSTYKQDVCGNQVIELTEQCDSRSQAGCSNSCVLSGSVPGLSLCGDGIIGPGEQCDDANLLLGGIAQSGDGCSNRCLVEDTSRGFCRSNATLRFDFKQGECFGASDCNTGYGCTQLSAASGNSNTGPVCGNGVVETGEECDFGNEPDGDSSDGCSDMCINLGSAQEINNPGTVGPFQVVDALANGFTTIQTWIASFAPPAGPQGNGALQVGDGTLGQGDPRIIERYPDCATACGNSAVGALFNVALSIPTLNSSNITLYECGADGLCNIVGRTPLGVSIAPRAVNVIDPTQRDAIDIVLPFNYNRTDINGDGVVDFPTLLPNTYYRVVVSNRVENLAGRSLVGLNFDDPNNAVVGPDSHSWVFRTQASSALCTVGRVEVHPKKITLPEGTLQTYFAEPWALGGSCDPLFGSDRGQRLNAYFYDWRWDTFEVDALDVADILVPLRDGCGNTIIEYGEDCDEGNTISGDGCNNICQNEGSNYSISSLSVCGNNSLEFGEDCDDGNTTNSDGCSSICLNEGNSNDGVPVCGNRIVETGEQCDTGSEPNGTDADGCTDICTFSGAVPGSRSICGDGQVGLGENCDAGELSSGAAISSNDGCTGTNDFSGNDCDGLITQTDCQGNTQWCHWTGTACETRACLNEVTTATGNANWNLSVCGNGVVEIGEECDLGDEPNGNNNDGCSNLCLFNGSLYADGRIDPYQIVQTSAIGSPVAEANEEIRAWHNLAPSIVGVGELKVVSGGLVDFAVIGHKPPVGDPNQQCLNVGISATFSRPLDLATLENNFRLCEGVGCDNASPNLAEELSYRAINGKCVNNECRFPHADAANLDFGFCSSNSDCVGSQVSVKKINTPDGFLARTETYNIIIDPANLLDANGTALSTSCLGNGTECNWTFQTSDNFCSCDFVGVGITNTSGGADTVVDTFTCTGNTCGQSTIFDPRDDDAADGIPTNESDIPGNQHVYEATCYDVNNPSGSRIALNPLGHYFSYVQFDPTDILLNFPVITDFGSARLITANPKNGQADIRVVATEYTCSGSGQLCDPTNPICPAGSTCQSKIAATQTVKVTNFICDNPWPSIDTFPYQDNEDNNAGPLLPDTNFSMFYCRDSGVAGIAGDLPALTSEFVSVDSPPSFKDFIFPVGTSGDAIGIKVLPNPLHLSPATWYRSGLCDGQADFENLCFSDANCSNGETCQLNIFDQGSYNEIIVDGYEAVKSGRTVYVGATNLSLPSLYSNIYLISYNQDAAPTTVEIFDRILDEDQQEGVWSFNNNLTNHRFCQNTGYYQGTDIACATVGLAQNSICESPSITTKAVCESNANIASGCFWEPSLNDCLAKVCEPIACTNDFECPNLSCSADKEMLVRDAKRYGDLRDTQILLENYVNRVGTYPSLRAGSYIASTTFSVWPSWQQTLSRDLGTSVAVDPINRFVGCPGFVCDNDGSGEITPGEGATCRAAVDTDTCPGPLGQCLPADADQARTCWDEVNLQFSCENVEGLVYGYRAAGNGTAYQLLANFEYDGGGSWRTGDYQLPLSNLAVGNSCQILDLEIGAATIAGGTTAPVFTNFYCYSGRADDGLASPCTTVGDCPGFNSSTRCSADADGDGEEDFGTSDNCAPTRDCSDFPNFANCFNPNQADADDPDNGIGDACDVNCSDDDRDGVCDQIDNCQNVWNANQVDIDNDGIGDVCDLCIDIDSDGFGSPGSTACQFGAALDCRDNPTVEPLAANIFPGAIESCTDGVDNNCDGRIDTQDIVVCPVDVCSDTDTGPVDYELQGTAAGVNGGQSFANTDFCTSLSNLTEYGCNGTTRSQNSINCATQFGTGWRCQSGECIPPLPQPDSCVDSDGGNNAQTLGSVSGFENSGQPFSNTDACSGGVLTEWSCSGVAKASNIVNCSTLGSGWTCSAGRCQPPPPPPDSCNDSDGSASNISVAGNANGISGGNSYVSSDTCTSATQVREYGCSGSAAISSVITCSGTDVCQSGACIQAPNTCNDSDGSSTNYNTLGTISGVNGGSPYSNQDSCSGNTLTEYGCSGLNPINSGFNCTTLGTGFTCQAGRCVPPPDTCLDSDGTNYQNQGTATGFSGGSSYSFSDSCPTTSTLTEWTCSGSSAVSNNLSCATQFGPGFVCSTGRCILANETGLCFDGQDNDIDGAIDCVDSDCIGDDNGIGQVCCGTNADCSTWVNGNIANNCASLATCNTGTRTCSFTPSNSLCGSGTNACGACNAATLTCGANTSACSGNCSGGCVAAGANNYQCQGSQTLCNQICSTCQNSGAGAFTCANVNNAQDCDGPGASQCCQTGFFCNNATPPQCVSCTDSDKDGICDNNDWCPYDPDNNIDSSVDNLCAVGCNVGSNPSGSLFFNGRLCDSVTPNPDHVVYDTCIGGGTQISSGLCISNACSNDGDFCSTNADCTNFITGSCTATNSCLVLFGADERLNVYINGTMVAGNLYLPPGFATNGELIGQGSRSYPNIEQKIFINTGSPLFRGNPSVVAFEAITRTWGPRQIRGAFVNSAETGFCNLLNYSPKYTDNSISAATAFPAYCYTEDNLQNTGLVPAPQGASAWNDSGYNPLAAGWILSVAGAPTAGPLTNLWTTGPAWMISRIEPVWSKTYSAAYTYSHAYCRSNTFNQP